MIAEHKNKPFAKPSKIEIGVTRASEGQIEDGEKGRIQNTAVTNRKKQRGTGQLKETDKGNILPRVDKNCASETRD